MSAEPATDRSFEERLRELDLSLFAHVPSETLRGDKISLLALENAVREIHGRFRYLEIGSHLGGSLQPFLADERCVAVASIDPRPRIQPDVRGDYEYPDNSTERMLEHLAAVPGADLTKLRTIEVGTDALTPDEVGKADLCFIDGEHTHDAALRDARFCREVVGEEGVIAFHDFGLVRDAVAAFVAELGDVVFSARKLPGATYAVEVGAAGVLESDWITMLWSDEIRVLWKPRRGHAQAGGAGG
jgi:Methyltransferase domain